MHFSNQYKKIIILTRSYSYCYLLADEANHLINPFQTFTNHLRAPCNNGWNSTVHITTIPAQIREIEKLSKTHNVSVKTQKNCGFQII